MVSKPAQESPILNIPDLNEFNGFENIDKYPGFA
jgi:hypothetical protein